MVRAVGEAYSFDDGDLAGAAVLSRSTDSLGFSQYDRSNGLWGRLTGLLGLALQLEHLGSRVLRDALDEVDILAVTLSHLC